MFIVDPPVTLIIYPPCDNRRLKHYYTTSYIVKLHMSKRILQKDFSMFFILNRNNCDNEVWMQLNWRNIIDLQSKWSPGGFDMRKRKDFSGVGGGGI